MYRIVSLVVLMFIGNIYLCDAQSQYYQSGLVEYFSQVDYGNDFGNSNEILGSKYVNKSFVPVKIGEDNKVFFARYNAYDDKIEVKKDNELYHLSKKVNEPIVFSRLNKTFQLFNYKENGTNKTGYFVLEYNGDGKATILLKEKVVFKKEKIQTTGYGNYVPPTMERSKDKLYISFGDNYAMELPTKKSAILSLFGNTSKEIESFVNKNNLSFKNKIDLRTIIVYYNSLVK